MIKFHQIKSFVYELLVLLFVLLIVLLSFFKMKWIEVVVHPNFLFTIAVVILLITIGRYMSRIVNWGIRAFLDFALQRVTVQEGCFENQLPFCASPLLDSRTVDGSISKGMYYMIEIQCKDKTCTFLSTTYLNLEYKKEYVFHVASSSSVILDVVEKDPH